MTAIPATSSGGYSLSLPNPNDFLDVDHLTGTIDDFVKGTDYEKLWDFAKGIPPLKLFITATLGLFLANIGTQTFQTQMNTWLTYLNTIINAIQAQIKFMANVGSAVGSAAGEVVSKGINGVTNSMARGFSNLGGNQ